MKKILLIAIVVISGCRAEGVSKEATNNTNYSVTTLFTHDGCTVYRFYDADLIYYVKCDGGKQSTQWDRSCGKNCTTTERVETEVYP